MVTVGSRIYMGNGDFWSGGRATVTSVNDSKNGIVVGVAELPGYLFTWEDLLNKQERHKEQFQGRQVLRDDDCNMEFYRG